MKRIVLVQAREPELVDAEQALFLRATGLSQFAQTLNLFGRGPGDSIPTLSVFDGVIMAGSSLSVSQRPPCLPLAKRIVLGCLTGEVPFFGVCFGFHVLAYSFGGGVEQALAERGGIKVRKRAEGFLRGLPYEWKINTYHQDAVTRIPTGHLQLVAESEFGVPHALESKFSRFYGVQGHPEHTPDSFRAFYEHYVRQGRLGGGGDTDRSWLSTLVEPNPCVPGLLRDFVESC